MSLIRFPDASSAWLSPTRVRFSRLAPEGRAARGILLAALLSSAIWLGLAMLAWTTP